MSADDHTDSISELIRKLSEIESAIEASSLDQVDVIVDPKTAKPILLRTAQEALIASKNQLEQEVLNKAAELERTIGDLYKEIQAREKVEEALSHSEEKFRLIADYTNDWETWLGQAGNYIYVSPACERITGYPAGEFKRNPKLALDIIHPDDRKDFERHRHAYSADQSEIGQIDYRILAKNGEIRWIGHFCRPIFGTNGEWLGRRESNRDITRRKRIEEELRKSEKRYHTLFDAMSEGSAIHEIITDARGQPCDYRFLEVNPAFERLTGLKRNDLIGKRVLEVMPKTEPYWIESYGRVALTGKPLHTENYSAELDRWYDVISYWIAPGRFAVIFTDITERKQIEEQLRERENELNLIINTVPALISYIDTNFRYQRVNEGYERWFGLTSRDLKGRHVKEVVGDEGWHLIQSRLERAAMGETISYEELMPFLIGGQRWIFVRLVPDRDAEGRVRGIVTLTTDITELKEAEEVLRQSEEHYRLLFETMLQGVVYQDVNGKIISMNPAAEMILGKTAEEFLGSSSMCEDSLTIREDGRPFPGLKHPSMVALQTGREVKNVTMGVYNPREGCYRWIDINAVPLFSPGEDKPYQVYTIFDDITDQKLADEALRESEERSRLAQSSAHVGIWDWHPNTGILNWTTELELLYGYEKGTFPGTYAGFYERVHPDDIEELERLRDNAVNSHQSFDFDFRILPSAGKTLWINCKGAATYDSAGRPQRIFGVNVDITERKLAEEALRKSEQELRLAHDLLEQVTLGTKVLIATIDKDYRYTFFNQEHHKELRRLTGKNTAIGMSLKEILADIPEELDKALALWNRALNGEVVNQTIMFGDPGRYRRWYGTRHAPIRDSTGKVIGAGEVTLDITESMRIQEKLKESEERLHVATESARAGMWSVNIPSQQWEFSPQAARLFGLADDATLTFDRAYAQTHPDDRDHLAEESAQSLAKEGEHELEYRIIRPNGEIRWLLLRGRTYLDAEGRAWRNMGVMLDITERKMMEQMLINNSKRLEILSEISSRLLASNRPQEIMEELCIEVMKFLDCHAFFNYLVDETEGRLLLNACAGISDESKRKIEWLDYGVAVCGCVASEGRLIVAENIPETPDPRTELVRSFGIKAYVCHPLMSEGKVIGTLSFGTNSKTAFNEDELSLMKAVADQVAIAMARVKLNEELRQLNEDLEQRIDKRTAELKAASLYSRILLESSLDPLVTISPEGKITDVNRATELATGLDRGELIGTDFAEYFTDPDAAKAGYMKVLADGDVRDYPLTINNTMAKMTDVLFNATIFPNEKGQLQGVFAAARDVTQLKKAELELREAKDNLEMINKELQLEISEHEKAEKLLLEAKEAAESAVLAKEAFMANMSHEIRTPMNAVIGMTSLLLDEDLTAEQKSFVEVIRSGGDAMLSIINEILDFSRLEKKRIELENQVLHLPNIIEEALDLAAPKAAEKKLNLAYMVDKKTPHTIMGDPTRIRQVLVNLLDNAVKFTEKGEVAVSVSSKLSDSMHDIHFSIKDTGIGIPAERLGSIFEPFNQADNSITRKYGGTGLGLTISRKLANLMGGDIWVESNAGNGSTFHFNILAKAVPGQPRSERITPLFKDKSILVVENNKTNRRILGRLAKDWGMIPTTTSSVKEAWKLIQAENGFDIAIVEMDAPEIDGIALGQEIRKHDKDMPIMMLTYAGHKVESDMFQATLAKPIKPAQLYNILNNVFSSQYAIVPGYETDKEDSKKSPLKILLAEDNFQSQKVIMQMLSKLGFSADLAANGLEALQALERQRYDIILMDVRMPEMNGLDATRIIRQRWPGPKPIIIAATAYGLEGDREKCLDAGMDDYISKPIKLKDLQSIIGKYTMPSNNESSILRG